MNSIEEPRLEVPVTTRRGVRQWTDFVFELCWQTGAEIKTCYTVAGLFATGIAHENGIEPQTGASVER